MEGVSGRSVFSNAEGDSATDGNNSISGGLNSELKEAIPKYELPSTSRSSDTSSSVLLVAPSTSTAAGNDFSMPHSNDDTGNDNNHQIGDNLKDLMPKLGSSIIVNGSSGLSIMPFREWQRQQQVANPSSNSLQDEEPPMQSLELYNAEHDRITSWIKEGLDVMYSYCKRKFNVRDEVEEPPLPHVNDPEEVERRLAEMKEKIDLRLSWHERAFQNVRESNNHLEPKMPTVTEVKNEVSSFIYYKKPEPSSAMAAVPAVSREGVKISRHGVNATKPGILCQCGTKYRKLSTHILRYTTEPKFRCMRCQKQYFGLNELRKHWYSAHHLPSDELNLAKLSGYGCRKCGQHLDTKESLMRHSRSVHNAWGASKETTTRAMAKAKRKGRKGK